MEERSRMQVKSNTHTRNHRVICAMCLRARLTHFSAELYFCTRQGHPMEGSVCTNDGVALHALLAWSMLRDLDPTVLWSLANSLSRPLISNLVSCGFCLVWFSVTFRIPLQTTVQSREIYVKCFLLESPSGQYSSCLVKYQDIHRTQVLMQIIRHKWPQ